MAYRNRPDGSGDKRSDFGRGLIKSGVSLELHLYPVGRHGLALATEETADGQESNIEPQCQSWIVLAENGWSIFRTG